MQYALKKEKEVIKRHGGLDEYVIYAIFWAVGSIVADMLIHMPVRDRHLQKNSWQTYWSMLYSFSSFINLLDN